MENVSHNTSYSECSPNVKDVDEEFVQRRPSTVLEEDEEPAFAQQQEPSQQVRLRYAEPAPPNLSQSEIDEMNFSGSPAGQRMVQALFKAADLVASKREAR